MKHLLDKVSGARLFARHLTRERNRSPSFHGLMKALTILVG